MVFCTGLIFLLEEDSKASLVTKHLQVAGSLDTCHQYASSCAGGVQHTHSDDSNRFTLITMGVQRFIATCHRGNAWLGIQT